MRAAEPLPPADAAIEAIREGLIRYFVEEDGTDRQRVRELRRRIADRIQVDLALLDALDGDPDAEPSLAAPEPVITSGWGNCPHSDQTKWGGGATDDREQDAGDEREEENEHGGDIQDEPTRSRTTCSRRCTVGIRGLPRAPALLAGRLGPCAPARIGKREHEQASRMVSRR